MSRYKQGQTSGAGYGIEGYDWPAEWEPALQAGAARGCGVAVVAGTSNNRGGRDRQGREGRVTGCGPRFGEYGGASEIVSRAVKAVSLA